MLYIYIYIYISLSLSLYIYIYVILLFLLYLCIINLGHKSNNGAKALALFNEISLLRNKGIAEAKIIGDTRIIIDSMMKGRELTNPLLNLYIKKSKSLLQNFIKIQFLHVDDIFQAKDTQLCVRLH